MRIMTNKPGAVDQTINLTTIRQALRDEQAAGRIAQSVIFKTLQPHGSRSHLFAFEIQLESFGHVPGDGRRYGNSGSYGAGDDYAATFDEWGWLLAALYRIDPEMMVGTPKYPLYVDARDFHYRTGLTYDPERLLRCLRGTGASDPYPFVTSRTNKVGRYGFGRSNGDCIPEREFAKAIEHYESGKRTMRAGSWVKFAPRHVDWVRKFAHLDNAEVTK